MPPTRHAEESGDFDTSDARSTPSNFTVSLSPDHPFTHTTPTLVLFIYRTARLAVHVPLAMLHGLSASIAKVAAMSDLAFLEDDKEEDEEEEDEGPAVEDEGPARAAQVVEIVVREPLGFGYEALRHREIALREGQMPSVFEVGQGSGYVPKPERPERVLALRHPTFTAWIDPKDGRVYIDVPAYPPPTPPVQTWPSLEWSSGSLPVSPAPSIVPSTISSPMTPLTVPSLVASPVMVEAEGFLTELGAQVEMQGGLIHDHTVQLGELSPVLFKMYDRDIGELFTRSGAASQTDAQRAALLHAISDTQIGNRELRLQIIEERHARLELAEIVNSMRRGNGIYEIDMINRVPNVNFIYTVSNKRAKYILVSTYLWHYRLAHISKKRIEKLQHDGILKSTDDESFDKYVFKNEVENQPGKTTKALRSDRGGEYISQEFKDYLKACGLVQQLTPPYTLQYNRVSERRNHTLLDM
nr:retrotransposon protein, putative, Ty1-copia subclass [Tanacetum cinerariifolium]